MLFSIEQSSHICYNQDILELSCIKIIFETNNNIFQVLAMDIFTVSFFGHREIESASATEKRLEQLLYKLITQKPYVEFLIGRDGEFDLMAASTIKRAVNSYGYGNTSLILVLPYMKAEYRDNEQRYLSYYDEVEICSESADAHYKSAIQVRNRSMVDRSDLVVCCVQHKSGGAYKTVQYAKRQGKQVRNLSDADFDSGGVKVDD